MTSAPECTEDKYYYLMGNEMNAEYLHNGIEGYISTLRIIKSGKMKKGILSCVTADVDLEMEN